MKRLQLHELLLVSICEFGLNINGTMNYLKATKPFEFCYYWSQIKA
jgi:hypothetical protein